MVYSNLISRKFSELSAALELEGFHIANETPEFLLMECDFIDKLSIKCYKTINKVEVKIGVCSFEGKYKDYAIDNNSLYRRFSHDEIDQCRRKFEDINREFYKRVGYTGKASYTVKASRTEVAGETKTLNNTEELKIGF